MRDAIIATCLSTVILICAGCGQDYHVKNLIQPPTEDGRVWQRLGGTGKQLVEGKQIDLHQRVKNASGEAMDVWVIRARPTAASGKSQGTVVILHDLGESKASFPYLGVAQRVSRKGYDAVLLDLRSHGRSEGKYVTHGIKEKYDVKAVLDSLVRDHVVHEPIHAFGKGYGGTVAIQYAALDLRCKGVVAISPHVNMRTYARRITGWIKPDELEKVLAEAGKKAGIDPDDASSLKAAAKLKIPLLVIHFPNMLTKLTDSRAVFDAAAGPRRLHELSIPDRTAMVVPAVQENWLAERIVNLATEGIPPASTQPSEAP